MLLLAIVGFELYLGRQVTRTQRSPSSDPLVISVATAILASCLFSPTTWAHYLVLAIFSLLVLIVPAYKNPRGILNPLTWFICYTLVALTQGRLRSGGLAWQYVSAWWGSFACLYMIGLLLHMKLLWVKEASITVEQAPRSGSARSQDAKS